ncbi:NmrA family transcriptional regulator [Tilletiaria anomala UBC 951]|uniref:NmrA family transcriptional regulator n=1 Tax=Tilletiaria anomala (strain ATCC 24038 / CBS 436.72 / UBC 951) TaxID=1037660 RepID=A0A066W2F7_TILAU|nr:NmrA family transcriptional regulator [Tilletiaria anomala UBC 951]KDN45264.1 NmrA family transcriptional regulator [Tilletiaria anomala UBC 951]
MSTRIVAVVGATGAQGSSVIKHLLHEPGYKLRALTRDPSKPAAQQLAAQGVDVVQADMSSYDDLKAAFTGAHAVYAVTNFWQHLDKAQEIEDGKRQAQAAKDAGVQHFIWSTLDNVAAGSQGKYTHVDHFDGKAEVEKLLPSIGINYTSVLPAAYWENFTSNFKPTKGDDGVYTLTLPISPDSVYSGFEAHDDTGKFVKAIIKGGDKFYDKRIYMCSEELPFDQLLTKWGDILGVKTRCQQVDPDTWKSFLPKQTAQEFYEMLAWFQDFGYYNRADVQPSQAIVEDKLTKWADYVKKADWKL